MEATPASVHPDVAHEWFRNILEGLASGTLTVPQAEQVRNDSFTQSAPVTIQKSRRPRHLRRERYVKKKKKVRPGHIEDLLPDFDEDHAARVNARDPDTF